MTGFPATAPMLVLALAFAFTGCGGDDMSEQQPAAAPAPPPTMTKEAKNTSTSGENHAALARRPDGEKGLRVPAKRARIVVEDSGFGRVLFDANGQVVYVFENDRQNRSNCTSPECVKAWPPVLTRQKPSAGADVDASKLGTIRRADGRMQVTYDGRPLYFYEHEEPGEIKCHNVDLHGGLWWVVTPGGDPAA